MPVFFNYTSQYLLVVDLHFIFAKINLKWQKK